MEQKKGKYDDIINLPHHTSTKHPRMTVLNRAAQFAPFAALTGYDDAIKEKARTTEEFITLTDEEKEIINDKILLAVSVPGTVATITYFQADDKKSGGRYIDVKCNSVKYDEYSQNITINKTLSVPLSDIVDVVLQ